MAFFLVRFGPLVDVVSQAPHDAIPEATDSEASGCHTALTRGILRRWRGESCRPISSATSGIDKAVLVAGLFRLNTFIMIRA